MKKMRVTIRIFSPILENMLYVMKNKRSGMTVVVTKSWEIF